MILLNHSFKCVSTTHKTYLVLYTVAMSGGLLFESLSLMIFGLIWHQPHRTTSYTFLLFYLLVWLETPQYHFPRHDECSCRSTIPLLIYDLLIFDWCFVCQTVASSYLSTTWLNSMHKCISRSYCSPSSLKSVMSPCGHNHNCHWCYFCLFCCLSSCFGGRL